MYSELLVKLFGTEAVALGENQTALLAVTGAAVANDWLPLLSSKEAHLGMFLSALGTVTAAQIAAYRRERRLAAEKEAKEAARAESAPKPSPEVV